MCTYRCKGRVLGNTISCGNRAIRGSDKCRMHDLEYRRTSARRKGEDVMRADGDGWALDLIRLVRHRETVEAIATALR